MNDQEIQRIRECELGLRIMRLQAEVARLNEENTAICQHVMGRDECEDLPGIVDKVLKERMESQAEVEKLQSEEYNRSTGRARGHYHLHSRLACTLKGVTHENVHAARSPIDPHARLH